jgi:ribosomal protein S18 acetylase RimI-like enzyme
MAGRLRSVQPPRVEPWDEQGRIGAVARRGDETVCRLLAEPREDAVRGAHAWASQGDHSLAAGEDAELYRDVYALAGARWLAAGLGRHYVVVAAEPVLLEAWHSLAFAREQVHARRAVEPVDRPGRCAAAIRRGDPSDLDRALSLAEVVAEHQARAPVWADVRTSAEEREASWRALLGRSDVGYFLAEREGEALGHLVMQPAGSGVAELLLAATRADARGLGIGRALTAAGLRFAAERGLRTCIADWRVANLAASRFWHARGFAPTAYRLVRGVDGHAP